jgi:hypothetical protein
MSMHYTGNKRRAEDQDKRWRWSEWFHKYSFIWWPLVLMGVAYPAKIVSGLRSESKQSVERVEQRLQIQIDTIKVRLDQSEDRQEAIIDILEALLRIRCTEMSDREIRRLGVPCERVLK